MSKTSNFDLPILKIDMDKINQNAVAANLSAVQKISWFDSVIIWIDQRPWPAWLTYAGLILAGELLFNLTFWIDGSVPFGERVTLQSVSIPLVTLSFAFYHYLTNAGSKALQDFRPLLEADDEEIAKIDRAINYLPSNLGWIVLLLSMVGSIFYVFGTSACLCKANRQYRRRADFIDDRGQHL
jgi:hypothetical protein